jgi:two-component system chemotaxis response regulator CheY
MEKNVLLLDRDARTKELSRTVLETLNLKVTCVDDAAQALRAFRTMDYPLLVTDWPLAGDPQAEELFHHLKQEGKAAFLMSATLVPMENPQWEGARFLSKTNRKELVEKAAEFFREWSDPAGAFRPQHPPRQILIIEDSLTLRGIVRRALQKGFPEDVIREAEEGKQALTQMSQKKVDLIITDLEMPGMDGHTFLQHLKSNSVLSKKPVLVFSSKFKPEIEEQFRAMPHVRLLAKPASPEKIISEVSELLKSSAPSPLLHPSSGETRRRDESPGEKVVT